MSVEEELLNETQKWIKKAENLNIEILDQKFGRNIEAYIKDSKYFLEKNDLVRAFECIIWAWAWIEIGEEIGVIKRRSQT
ncbi:MAG: DUF357 domain-containing protein [Archaeoglobus sp.]|nr:DUF357 domain-containing protein [Archaeoglobus sp.]